MGKEIEELKRRINKAKIDLFILKDIIQSQPSRNKKDDEWLLERLQVIANDLIGKRE